MIKDNHNNVLSVGDYVAYNLSGSVTTGHVKQILPSYVLIRPLLERYRTKRKYTKGQGCVKQKEERWSKVKNPDGILKLSNGE